MQIIEPKVELLEQGDNIVSHVARCARVCYDKETGNNDERLYKELIQKHHWSVFRHASYYAIIPQYSFLGKSYTHDIIMDYKECPYVDFKYDKNSYFIATNGNFMLDNCKDYETDIYKLISNYLVSPEEFTNTDIGRSMMRYTFLVTTQISTSRELNRVSPNNITELSTRYVDLKNRAICRPYWMTKEEAEIWNDGFVDNLSIRCETYLRICEHAFDGYRSLIATYDFKREDARGVLPIDTSTKVIYTYSVKEWTDIINKRVNMITGRAHENAKIVINMIKKELEGLGYDFG